uniref:Putative secreted protein n=1 Tax=Anopheles darlingi TaxID=43151 RepID=A0A2M4D7Q7_ANODA
MRSLSIPRNDKTAARLVVVVVVLAWLRVVALGWTEPSQCRWFRGTVHGAGSDRSQQRDRHHGRWSDRA